MSTTKVETIELPAGEYVLKNLETTTPDARGYRKSTSHHEPFNITVGKSVFWPGRGFSDSFHTSMVTEIQLLKNNAIAFRTLNSTYLIEQIEDN